MSYKSSISYIEAELCRVEQKDIPRKRLELDLADILTCNPISPTSLDRTVRVARNATSSAERAHETACAMREAVERYFRLCNQK